MIDMCASGGECEGICRDHHLHRKRNWTSPKDVCPEQYQVKKKGQ